MSVTAGGPSQYVVGALLGGGFTLAVGGLTQLFSWLRERTQQDREDARHQLQLKQQKDTRFDEVVREACAHFARLALDYYEATSNSDAEADSASYKQFRVAMVELQLVAPVALLKPARGVQVAAIGLFLALLAPDPQEKRREVTDRRSKLLTALGVFYNEVRKSYGLEIEEGIAPGNIPAT